MGEVNHQPGVDNQDLIIGENQESCMIRLLNELYTYTKEHQIEEATCKRLRMDVETIEKFVDVSPPNQCNVDALQQLQHDYQDTNNADSEMR